MRAYTNSELCLIWLDSFLGLEYKHKQELYNCINGKTDLKAFDEEKLLKYEIENINRKNTD